MTDWTIKIISWGNGYCEYKAVCDANPNKSYIAKSIEELKQMISEYESSKHD